MSETTHQEPAPTGLDAPLPGWVGPVVACVLSLAFAGSILMWVDQGLFIALGEFVMSCF